MKNINWSSLAKSLVTVGVVVLTVVQSMLTNKEMMQAVDKRVDMKVAEILKNKGV